MQHRSKRAIIYERTFLNLQVIGLEMNNKSFFFFFKLLHKLHTKLQQSFFFFYFFTLFKLSFKMLVKNKMVVKFSVQSWLLYRCRQECLQNRRCLKYLIFSIFSPLKTNVLVFALAVSILSCDCLLSKPFDGNTEHPTRTEPSLCRWKRPQLTCFLPEGRRERAAAAERFRSSSFHTLSQNHPQRPPGACGCYSWFYRPLVFLHVIYLQLKLHLCSGDDKNAQFERRWILAYFLRLY